MGGTPSQTGKLFCRGLISGQEEAYFNFARKAWGEDSAQAESSRLKWLYKANPLSQGSQSDLLVLWSGNEIIGAHHRMRLLWRIGHSRIVLPSIGNMTLAILEPEVGTMTLAR